MHRRLEPHAVRQARGRGRRVADRQGGERCGRRRRARPERHRRDRARALRRRLQRPGLHQLARAPGRRGLALQAGDPRGERLRHRLGGDPSGAEVDRRQAGALRARGRRREDDRPARAGDRASAPVRRLPQGGERDRGRLCRRVRPDRPALFPAARRSERRARDHRRQEPPERLRQSARADGRTWASSSAARSRTRTRWSPDRWRTDCSLVSDGAAAWCSRTSRRRSA